MISPVLVHTAEEIWLHLRDMMPLEQSVHLSLWPDIPDEWRNDNIRGRMRDIFDVRYAVRRKLEALRVAETLKRSESARVILWSDDEALKALMDSHSGAFADLFKVSEVRIAAEKLDGMEPDTDLASLFILAEPVEYEKCARCWNHRSFVGTDIEHPDLCERCKKAI